MRAAQLIAPRRFELVDVPIPEPGPGEVLVRLEGCGVCASNIPPWEGREWFTYPMEPGALGHEGWGRVAALGPGVIGWTDGDRVAFVGQRSYAEYDVCPADALVKAPRISPGQVQESAFPGEPLGCAINIFKRSCVRRGEAVAIVGVGFLGALLTQLATAAGAKVIALARKGYALNVAREMGASHAVPMDEHSRIINEVRELTAGRFCDVVIECTGKQWPLDLAAEITKERGRLVVAGFHQDGLRQVNMFLWNWKGLDVINAHERDPRIYAQGMEEAARAVETGRMAPAALYTHRLTLEDLNEALRLTSERPDGFMKALVEMGG